MAEINGNRLTKYFPLLLDALRSSDNGIMRPAEAVAWIRARVNIPESDLTRVVVNGSQSIFENDVHWARFYLVKAGLINKPKRGLWGLTVDGMAAHLTPEETWDLYVRIREVNRPSGQKDDEDLPAPETTEEDAELGLSYWFVGSVWNTVDQFPRFLKDGIWENGYEDQFSDLVRRMKPGDRIAIKASSTRKNGIPFDVGGKSVSFMRIKATGIVLQNQDDGHVVKVAWDPPSKVRDWYFYTYRTTIVKADGEDELGRSLINFTFRGAPQDYAWWLNQPYWAEKYGNSATTQTSSIVPDNLVEEIDEIDEEQSYTVDDIVNEGCFLTRDQLIAIIDRWRIKKNLILQGPPGTGKTWLAKRLGCALSGSNDRETSQSRLRVVQFHASLAYEDFVRGWRPAGDGRLALVDGILMQAIEAAASEPDRPFVLVIEEINRGNPAQIFGEMLTLLENTKRKPTEAIELAYRNPQKAGEKVYVPANLFVIGTMNVADRMLAIVDLAFRRRFMFIDLEPQLGPAWLKWCTEHGLGHKTCIEIETRMALLNAEISAATSLGPQFRIGHSYVTPHIDEPMIHDGNSWFRAKVETEIAPLLEEYWYDAPEKATRAREKLLEGLT